MRRQVVLVFNLLYQPAGLYWPQQTARGPGRNGWAGRAAGFVQNATYDKTRPNAIRPQSGGVLIFSRPPVFERRLDSASNAALAAIAQERGWPYFITENGPVMNAGQLAKFKL